MDDELKDSKDESIKDEAVKDEPTKEEILNREVEKIESLEKNEAVAVPVKTDSDTAKEESKSSDNDKSDNNPKSSTDVHVPSQRLADSISESRLSDPLEDEEKLEKIKEVKESIKNESKAKNVGVLKGGLAVSVVLALVGFGLAGWFFVNYNKLNNESSTTNSRLASRESKYKNELETLKSKSKAELESVKKSASEEAIKTERSYRYIPELGVRYKTTEENEDFIYTLVVTEDTKSKGIERLNVSTRSLANTKVEKTQNNTPYPCTANSAAVGMLEKIPETAFDEAKDKGGNITTKKLGKFYIKFYYDQSICGGYIPAGNEADAISRQLGKPREVMKKIVESMGEIK